MYRLENEIRHKYKDNKTGRSDGYWMLPWISQSRKCFSEVAAVWLRSEWCRERTFWAEGDSQCKGHKWDEFDVVTGARWLVREEGLRLRLENWQDPSLQGLAGQDEEPGFYSVSIETPLGSFMPWVVCVLKDHPGCCVENPSRGGARDTNLGG